MHVIKLQRKGEQRLGSMPRISEMTFYLGVTQRDLKHLLILISLFLISTRIQLIVRVLLNTLLNAKHINAARIHLGEQKSLSRLLLTRTHCRKMTRRRS
jgi:hypothetical protein